MTDTHTHLYMDAFSGEESEAVERALVAGVTRLVFPGVSPAEYDSMMALHRRFPENTRVALGLHPTELGDDPDAILDDMENLLPGDFSAIGEIGIDLHWEDKDMERQQRVFARQLGWARKWDLPLIIHCRDGLDALLEVLRQEKESLPVMIFHSFTSGPEDVRKIREVCDPYFGINGVATFKNGKEVREAIPEIGIDRIVLETDSPYLAPVPHRGTRNESSYIPLICGCVASTLGLPEEEVERITDENAARIFSFPLSGS